VAGGEDVLIPVPKHFLIDKGHKLESRREGQEREIWSGGERRKKDIKKRKRSG